MVRRTQFYASTRSTAAASKVEHVTKACAAAMKVDPLLGQRSTGTHVLSVLPRSKNCRATPARPRQWRNARKLDASFVPALCEATLYSEHHQMCDTASATAFRCSLPKQILPSYGITVGARPLYVKAQY